MKWKFYERLPQWVEYGGKRYRLNLTVANVLRYIDLCDDPQSFNDREITEIGFAWLVRGGKRLSVTHKAEILALVVRQYVSPPRRQLNNYKPQSVVNFYHDSGYIYAAFMQTYGIDLYQQAEKLHWCRFLALFDGLPEECVIKQIMGIRAREIPLPNSYNHGDIQRLTELKALYALPAENKPEDTQSGWNRLFDILEANAR